MPGKGSVSGGSGVTTFLEGTFTVVPGSVVALVRSFSTCLTVCDVQKGRKSLENGVLRDPVCR